MGMPTNRAEKREAKTVWPAIIDEVTFQGVGKILEQNRRRYRPHKAAECHSSSLVFVPV
jgi:hypothetical protein